MSVSVTHRLKSGASVYESVYDIWIEPLEPEMRSDASERLLL
jgi:hypothetical protein